jgi:hypothetical protein
MSWPPPFPGLVIRYSYLWASEAARGQEEGSKDRPCAVVLVVERRDDGTVVGVVPVTHSPPRREDAALELPPGLKRHLGLDADRSWVIASELNVFRWPGPDLRPAINGELGSIVYGVLPPGFFSRLKTKLLQATPRTVRRSD